MAKATDRDKLKCIKCYNIFTWIRKKGRLPVCSCGYSGSFEYIEEE